MKSLHRGVSALTEFFHAFTQLELRYVFLLNISSGIPMAFLTITLLAYLQDGGVSIEKIGLIGLVTQPYVFKVLWAPLIDRCQLPYLGRYRDWMLTTQLLMIPCIIGMAHVSIQHHFTLYALLALVLAILSATQDIAINAYQTSILTPTQRGLAGSYAMIGYQIGMILSGAIALNLTGLFDWNWVHIWIAATLLIGVISTLKAPFLNTSHHAHRHLRDTLVRPFQDFLIRFSPKTLCAIGLFLALYKLSDAFSMSLSTPFLQIIGFSKPQIGSISKAFGLSAVILGGLVGGYWMRTLSLYRCLWLFGILQIVGNIGFWILSLIGKHVGFLIFAIGLQNFSSGMGSAAFLAMIMALCSLEFSATQFALMTALSALGRTYIQPIAGYLVAHLGWSLFFVYAMLSGLPGLGILWYLRRNTLLSSLPKGPKTSR